MHLEELINGQPGNYAERWPEAQIPASGREISLIHLNQALEAWQKSHGQSTQRAVDRRRYREQKQLEQSLVPQVMALADMAFGFSVLEGYSKQFVRAHLLRENPNRGEIIQELFDDWTPSRWLLFAYVKAIAGYSYLDFCHIGTRSIESLMISVNSPISDYFEITNPKRSCGFVVYLSAGEKDAIWA